MNMVSGRNGPEEGIGAPIIQSALCPILVGRAQPLTTIQYHVDRMVKGQHHSLLIAGEAGMGKSRLVDETRALAERKGLVILQGECTELEYTLAYAPLVDLLRKYGFKRGQSLVEVLQALGPGGSELITLFPEIAATLPLPAVRHDQDKFRLYQAVVEFCTHAAGEQALLFIIEDLHWGGRATLDLILYLVRHLSNLAVLFLFTYNQDEINPVLSRFLAQMDRERHSTEIDLLALQQEDVDEMVQAILRLQRPTPTDILQLLYLWSEGNPFVVEEILKSMLTAGDILVDEGGARFRTSLDEPHIPRSVQDAVQHRSSRLKPEARETLTLAAVLGREFEFKLIQRLRGREESQLLDDLRELISAQFIVEASADRFTFRHALTRETVYKALLARERRRLHRMVAETLEQIGGEMTDQHLSDLAYHSYRGELWSQALRYEQQAGERATALYASQAAVLHFSHALEAATQLSIIPVQLLHQRGQAHAALNRFDAALADFEAALTAAQDLHDDRWAWETLLALGHLWTARDYSETGEYFRQALDLARKLADPAMVAHSLNNIGNWQMNRGMPFAALRDHKEALAVFQKLDDISAIAQTLDFLAIASFNCADVVQGRAYYRRALSIWNQLDDQRGLVHTLSGLALGADFDLEVDDTPVAESVTWGEKSVAVARELGSKSSESLSLICLGLAQRQQGKYGQAMAQFQQALAIAEDIEHREWMVDARFSLGTLYGDVLALEDARPLLETALSMAYQINSGIWISYVSVALATVCMLNQELEQAHSVLNDVLAADTPMQSLLQRVLWMVRAELALASGDPDMALQLGERLIQSTPNLAPQTALIVSRLWLLRGRALSELKRFSEAEKDITASLSVARSQGRRRLLWQGHAALGQIYLAQKEPALAEREITFAQTELEDLAASLTGLSLPQAGSLPEHFLQQASALLPDIHRLSQRQRERERFGGLTEREREVALLVAQGNSNREIGEALVLSERTAERHIANIMAKLGFNSRAQIAAWVVEIGLK